MPLTSAAQCRTTSQPASTSMLTRLASLLDESVQQEKTKKQPPASASMLTRLAISCWMSQSNKTRRRNRLRRRNMYVVTCINTNYRTGYASPRLQGKCSSDLTSPSRWQARRCCFSVEGVVLPVRLSRVKIQSISWTSSGGDAISAIRFLKVLLLDRS